MRHTRRKRLMSEINVVPYIDVMLVLLVIFMITAPLLTQGVKIDLPQAAAKPIDRSEQEPLVVAVDASGRFYLNLGDEPEQPIEAATLLTRVSAVLRHRPNVPVLVRGHRDVAYGDVVFVMSLLQKAGAPSVGLVTEPPEDIARR
ncbi:MAG: protein TolR [Gammaproteobacteria bacterium]|nr:protein TolR [Gammaproteobacteria bacterium]